jgi:ferric-dicitrate binding protein FerR (iron transport regulator)
MAWFRQTDPVHILYWDNWLAEHPENKADTEAAVALLKLMDLQEVRPASEQTLRASERLMAAITEEVKVIPLYRRKAFIWTSAAAAIAVIFFVSFLFKANSTTQYITLAGETKTISLPDGSQVILNTNSTLRVAANREVWLEGEGFFSIKPTTHSTGFMVHANKVDVEVLGTEFNVKQRSEQTTVVLKSGKVRLTLDEKKIMMAPGDLVAYSNHTGKIDRKVVNANIYAAWKEGQMIFENASIREIAGILEENYGVKVTIADSALNGKEFNGVFPTNNSNVLFKALSKAYNLDIDSTGETITIRSK